MMSAPSDLELITGRPVSRRRLRRLRRRLSALGVEMTPQRLNQIAGGAALTEDERFDVRFADTAAEIRRDDRRRTRGRARRRAVRWALVAGAVMLALNVLMCLGAAFILLAEHRWPY